MYWKHLIILLATVAHLAVSGPVRKPAKEPPPQDKEAEHGEEWEQQLEYSRYLKEVVQALESDPEFRKKLESAEPEDIKTGKISQELHFVDHNVRTKLDELKRQELERLRHLAMKAHENEIGIDRKRLKIPTHLDYKNPARFEVEDLKKLILQTTKELEEADKQRRDEFQKYEMEKEFEYQQKLNGIDDEEKKKIELEHQNQLKKHKDHPKLHEPGTKDQFREVWEEEDDLDPSDFKPETFFKLHDLDGNDYWDPLEVKALFRKELDKMYSQNASEDDMIERMEEMERMREHVFQEADLDRDGLISFEEFMEQTRKKEFEQDDGWEGIDEDEQYTPDEYSAFQREREEEIRRLVESGAIAPPPGYYAHPPAPVHPAVAMQHGSMPPQQGYMAHPQAGYPQTGYHQPVVGGYPQGAVVPPNLQQPAQIPPQPVAGHQPPVPSHQQQQQQQQQFQQQQFQQQQQMLQQQQQQYQPVGNQLPQGQPVVNQGQQQQIPQGQQQQIPQGQQINSHVPQGQPIGNQVPQGQPINNQVPQGQPINNQVPQAQQPVMNQGQPAPVQGQPLAGQGQPIPGQIQPQGVPVQTHG